MTALLGAAQSCSEAAIVPNIDAPLTALTVSPPSIELNAGETQQFTAAGRRKDGSEIAVDVAWSATGGEISANGVFVAGSDAGVFEVVGTVGRLADTALVTLTMASSPGATVLFSETFDSPGFAARGWYDIASDLPTTTAETRPGGGLRSLEWNWPQGSIAPTPRASARRLFEPTDRVYLRYWIKFSSNWIGSDVSYHPHEFLFLTTLSGEYAGPASTQLTAYVEHNWRQAGGFPVVSMQDAMNIDQSRIGENLVGVTENRAAHGCNGFGDAHGAAGTCYSVGSVYSNGRAFGHVDGPLWTDQTSAPDYKGNWHKVEAYFQLNTVREGIGIADGTVRYWFDDRLIIDVSGVLMRTGQHPDMLFNQLLLGPHIGVGSPVAQTAWIDDLVVATGRVP